MRVESAQTASVSMACAFAILTASHFESRPDPGETSALVRAERYCVASWRGAGIPSQEWADCTQETLAHLFASIPPGRLGIALRESTSPERRYLKRAVWRTVQRWRRAPRFGSLDDHPPAAVEGETEETVERAEAIETALGRLSPLRARILRLQNNGWTIAEIAQELGLPPARVSDEKYKALQVLRTWAELGC